VAVYPHQVEACAGAGPRLLAESGTPEAALRARVALFVEFLVTKHGLASAPHGDGDGSDALQLLYRYSSRACLAENLAKPEALRPHAEHDKTGSTFRRRARGKTIDDLF